MNEELKSALKNMQEGLESKTADQIKEEMKAFSTQIESFIDEEKAKGIVGEELKTVKEGLEAELKSVQKHLDKLDVKMKDKQQGEKEGENYSQAVKSVVKDNLEEIGQVRKGNSVKLEVKADMTLASTLTGDQPRDYSFDVAKVPSQLVNFSDLIGSISISGGTYTYPRETGGSGAIATQVEGSDKANVDYTLSMIDVATDFIAGYAVYSKKMRNNLPFLQSFLPMALRRDYIHAESTIFNTALAAAATASTETAAGAGSKAHQILNELATLEAANFGASAIVMTPADWYDILKSTRPTTGSDYSLPGLVSLDGGVLRFNGTPVVKANWLAANKYYVGDWSTVSKVVTEGLSLEFSESDEDNFRKNNITARIESQVGLAIHRPDSIIYGDFTAA